MSEQWPVVHFHGDLVDVEGRTMSRRAYFVEYCGHVVVNGKPLRDYIISGDDKDPITRVFRDGLAAHGDENH